MNDDFWDGTASGNDIDLHAFFDSDISDGLIRVLSLGVLLSLGLTRDRGAVGITILDNGKKRREYFRRSEDAREFLSGAVAALSGNGIGRSAGQGPVSQKPLRGA